MIDAAPQFILASRSPRRVELLRGLGLRFECRPADVPEIPAPGESPAGFARRLARSKAQAAGGSGPDAGLPRLGADTDVSVDGRILGKPGDRDAALQMLASLSGRTHQVCSAVALVVGERVFETLTVTDVEFGPITRAEAEAYWDSGEPADKAGAYAIQGGAARWVRAIRGSYTGVVGLPLLETLELLAQAGIAPAARPASGA